MKSPFLPGAAILATLLCSTGALRAEPSGVSIRVEQANKSDMGAKDRYTRAHARTLNVFVTNNSGEALQLKVKHIIFGRGMLKHDMVTIGEGEVALTVKPHSTEKAETPVAKVTSVEEHFDAKAKKKLEATGATIVGAGVQVLNGGTVVAEWYDPASIKEQWGKTILYVAPPPVKK